MVLSSREPKRRWLAIGAKVCMSFSRLCVAGRLRFARVRYASQSMRVPR
jgi:hypothetical protein